MDKLKSIFSKIKELLDPDYGSSLDAFIESKNPENSAQVDYWVAYWQNKQNKKLNF